MVNDFHLTDWLTNARQVTRRELVRRVALLIEEVRRLKALVPDRGQVKGGFIIPEDERPVHAGAGSRRRQAIEDAARRMVAVEQAAAVPKAEADRPVRVRPTKAARDLLDADKVTT